MTAPPYLQSELGMERGGVGGMGRAVWGGRYEVGGMGWAAWGGRYGVGGVGCLVWEGWYGVGGMGRAVWGGRSGCAQNTHPSHASLFPR